jgi:GT2 family glycosyltransferase
MTALHASVVIATRDRPADLRRCLDALAAQATSRPFEVVVVDDGSRPPIAAPDGAGRPLTRVVRLAGGGPARARNAGVAEARGEVVLFTDDDTAPDPGWLEAACAFLDAHPECVGVEGPIVSPPYDRLYEISLENSGPGAYWTANVAYRRSALAALGGFHERFPHAHCEDLDLGFRAERLGGIGFVEAMRVTHFPRPISLRRHVARGRMIVAELELIRRHRARYRRAARLPGPVFAFSNAVRYWIDLGRAERGRLLRPRRLARFAAMAGGHLATTAVALAAAVLRGRSAATGD